MPKDFNKERKVKWEEYTQKKKEKILLGIQSD